MTDPLRRSLLVVLLLGGTLALSNITVADPDLWGHVRYGEDVLDSGRLPMTATHTFTAARQPWINHETLSEIAFAAVVRHVGAPGLLVLRGLLGLGLVAAMIAAAARGGANAVVTAVVVMVAAHNIAPGWLLRPQLFSFVFFALMILVLDAATAGARRWLWVLPPLFVVWANTHGGFLAGLGILAAYLGCEAIEALGRRRPDARAIAATHAAVVAVSGLATLLNPYGAGLLRWLLFDLAPPRPEITEWAPLTPPDAHFLPFLALLAITIVAWLWSTRPRPLAQTAAMALATWQSVAHLRHIPFLATMVGFWVAPHLESAWRRVRTSDAGVASSAGSGVRAMRWTLRAAAVILAALLALRGRSLWVDKSHYPVEAFDFMAEHGLTGRLVAYFDWSQYAIAAFAPPTTLAFDGRFRTCYPQDVADMHFDFVLGDVPGHRWRGGDGTSTVDATRVLDYGDPELVLISRGVPHAVRIMEARLDWVLLYQDGLAQLWGRRRLYDDPGSGRYLPPEDRSISDRPQLGYVPWPALPAAARSVGLAAPASASRE